MASEEKKSEKSKPGLLRRAFSGLSITGKGKPWQRKKRVSTGNIVENKKKEDEVISLHDLDAIRAHFKHTAVGLRDFRIGQLIGTGTFGQVRLVSYRIKKMQRSSATDRKKPPKHTYAMKSLFKSEIIRLKQVEHTKSEIRVLSELHHPFLVNMHTYFQDREAIHLIMEFVIGGEMFARLRDLNRLDNSTSRFYAAEVVCALEYIHSKGLAYRDLKPENILIDAQGHVKIADFGFCKKVPDRTYTLCGTPEYLAPEIIKNKGHGQPVDWWGLGILIYEMLTGFPPFYDAHNNPSVIYRLILANKVKFPKYVKKAASDLITNLLQEDISKRLGCGHRGSLDIQDHHWFKGMDWKLLETRGIMTPWTPPFSNQSDARNFDHYEEGVPKLRNLTDAEQQLFESLG